MENHRKCQIRVWHLYWFWYEQISEYICNKTTIRTNIRIHLYQNNDMKDCPNIFVWNEMIQTLIEWIFVSKMTRMFEYLNILHTLPEYDFDTNEYPNIFISRKWYKQISEYIFIEKINRNKCPNKYSWHIYSSIRIYSSHSVPDDFLGLDSCMEQSKPTLNIEKSWKKCLKLLNFKLK